MATIIEGVLGYLLQSQRARDAKAFTTLPAFDNHKEPMIDIVSPDLGATNATLTVDFTHDGSGRFPSLQWKAPDSIASSVKEWLLISEDPDAPLPTPICHGIYLGIPVGKSGVTSTDFEIEDKDRFLLKGGFYFGQSRNGTVYIAPRPLINHGVHRYFFFLVALSEPLDKEFLTSKPTRAQVAAVVEGKVLGWGKWIGRCERRWT